MVHQEEEWQEEKPEQKPEQKPEEKPEQKPETITTTIEIEKELFLMFKALCVLKELKISSEIERLIKRRVEELSESTDLPSSREE